MSHKHHKKSIVPIPFPRNDSLIPVGPNEPGKNWLCVAHPTILLFTSFAIKVVGGLKLNENLTSAAQVLLGKCCFTKSKVLSKSLGLTR